jgi:hypothetical protein
MKRLSVKRAKSYLAGTTVGSEADGSAALANFKRDLLKELDKNTSILTALDKSLGKVKTEDEIDDQMWQSLREDTKPLFYWVDSFEAYIEGYRTYKKAIAAFERLGDSDQADLTPKDAIGLVNDAYVLFQEIEDTFLLDG